MREDRVIRCDRCHAPICEIKAGEPVNVSRWLCHACRWESKYFPAPRVDRRLGRRA